MRLFVGLFAAAALAAFSVPAAAAGDPTVEVLRARVEFAAETGQLAVRGTKVVSGRGLPLLYGDVGYQPLWRDPAKVAELIEAIRDSYDDGLLPVDYHLTALARLAPEALTASEPETVAAFDILATDAYMLLLYHMYFGKVDPVSIEPTWNFSTRQISGQAAVEFARNAIMSGELLEAVDSLRPKHWMYQHGRDLLRHHRQILANGGWPEVPPGETLKPGISDPRVVALRERLAVTGELAGQPLDTELYDEPLLGAVRAFQERHRLKPDGEVGPATLAELNVPVEARIRQIQVNLERGRHVLHEIGDEDLVIVDIAGYEVRYVQSRKVTWSARVQVGRPYRETPIFKSAIDHVVVNPTWTVPPTILAKDILPAVQRDRSYLARRGLEVIDRSGQPVDADSIAWSKYTGKTFPYSLRQAAGEDNALGRVKIMFPNQYSVYLHDTPSRELFRKEDRAFSSGCIRVDRPFELVERLLADPAWDAPALQAAVDAGQTRTLRLKKPVTLLLMYWTVDEDDYGRVIFKRDIYGRDALLWRALHDRFEFGTRPVL